MVSLNNRARVAYLKAMPRPKTSACHNLRGPALLLMTRDSSHECAMQPVGHFLVVSLFTLTGVITLLLSAIQAVQFWQMRLELQRSALGRSVSTAATSGWLIQLREQRDMKSRLELHSLAL